MKQLSRILVSCALIVAAFALINARPAAAQTACIVGDTGYGGTAFANIDHTHSYTLNEYDLSGNLIASVPEPFVADIVNWPLPSSPTLRIVLLDNSLDCSSYCGPGIPNGFVLKSITCTTAVFDSAGGNPVSGATVTQGQTWYVNPTPVKDGKGKSWTEIFVSGVPNGFIWSSCVQ
jgi:hypothetical protein